MTILFDRVLYKDLPKDLKKKVYMEEEDFINDHYEEQGFDSKADRKEVMEYINDHVYTIIQLRNGDLEIEKDGRW